MNDHDERDLEALFRRDLHRHAEEMDVSAPVATRAREQARSRSRSRVVMGVAAACVAAVAVTGAVVTRDDPGPAERPPVADRTTERPGDPLWRTEHWRGVQVDVPAEWGWGPAPVRTAPSGALTFCGRPGAVVDADGRRAAPDPAQPWVGRPVWLSDLCFEGVAAPLTPYVWLGADLRPGRLDLGNGYVQETVEVAGTTVTVASDDADLRAHVLGSAGLGSLCDAELTQVPSGNSVVTPVGELQEASVCAYSRRDRASSQPYRLVAGSVLPVENFERLETLLGDAPERPVLCKDVPEFVVVTGWYNDAGPYQRLDRVFELACGVVELWPGKRVRATQDLVDTWRTGVHDVSLSHFMWPQG